MVYLYAKGLRAKIMVMHYANVLLVGRPVSRDLKLDIGVHFLCMITKPH